jgi:antitoxin Phd
VRLARTQGPQRVTCRGDDVVVVLAAEEFARLAGAEPEGPSLGKFLRGSGLGEVDVTREEDRGREIAL